MNKRREKVLHMVMPDEILQIRDAIVGAIPAEKIYLFGSYANGTPNEDSDYDIYVVFCLTA
jgi:predicted nucleotidyltransferase